MHLYFAARATAFSLSALLTLALLGSIDHLATSEPGVPGTMASASQPRA